jgi:uncharacterized membrane protein
METLAQALTIMALVGSALIAGVFFAFSNFIMKAFAERPAPEGMAAMQAINVTVINPAFLGAFMGTAGLCVVLGVLVILGHSGGNGWILAGALCYFFGTFGVTVVGNIPLNNALAEAQPHSAEGRELWARYLERWTRFNTLRTVAALAATACLLAAVAYGA